MSYYIPVRCSWEQGGETVTDDFMLGLLIGGAISVVLWTIYIIYVLKS